MLYFLSSVSIHVLVESDKVLLSKTNESPLPWDTGQSLECRSPKAWHDLWSFAANLVSFVQDNGGNLSKLSICVFWFCDLFKERCSSGWIYNILLTQILLLLRNSKCVSVL